MSNKPEHRSESPGAFFPSSAGFPRESETISRIHEETLPLGAIIREDTKSALVLEANDPSITSSAGTRHEMPRTFREPPQTWLYVTCPRWVIVSLSLSLLTTLFILAFAPRGM